MWMVGSRLQNGGFGAEASGSDAESVAGQVRRRCVCCRDVGKTPPWCSEGGNGRSRGLRSKPPPSRVQNGLPEFPSRNADSGSAEQPRRRSFPSLSPDLRPAIPEGAEPGSRAWPLECNPGMTSAPGTPMWGHSLEHHCNFHGLKIRAFFTSVLAVSEKHGSQIQVV